MCISIQISYCLLFKLVVEQISLHGLHTYIYTHNSAPASIAADMVEVSASTNPLDVNLTVSYVSGDSITHAYPYMYMYFIH